MKRILTAYYELTVIPAIVLGCITSIFHPIFNYMAIGILNLPTIGEAVGATILFLVLMTIEHVCDAYRGEAVWFDGKINYL